MLTGKGSVAHHKINICSFDLAGKLEKAIQERNFQLCIIDESHYLKNMLAKRTKALVPILQKVRRVVLLSGTPALSRPKELFSQLHVLNQSLFSNFAAFATRYCAPKSMPWGMDYNGSSNAKELNAVMSILMIRRKKDQVLDQLPPKTRQKVLLYVAPKLLAGISKKKSDQSIVTETLFSSDSMQELNDAKFAGSALFFEMFRSTGRAKLPAVIEYLLERVGEDEEESGQKFLIFGHHMDVLDGISQALAKKKIAFIRIDGKTQSIKRQPLVDEFQTNSKIRVAVLSITAAGVGLTLTAAQNVIFAELYYNPGALMQAEDRAHRIGQRGNVQVHYLVARGTVDEHMFRLLNKKISILGETLDGVSGTKLEVGLPDQNKEIASKKLMEISEDAFLRDLSKLVEGKEIDEDNGTNDEPTPPKDVDEVLDNVRKAAVDPMDKFKKFMFKKE